MAVKTVKKREFRFGQRINIPVALIEFDAGSHTIWVQSAGGTVMRIKCKGKINIDLCKDSPISHTDILVDGDINFCLAEDIV